MLTHLIANCFRKVYLVIVNARGFLVNVMESETDIPKACIDKG